MTIEVLIPVRNPTEVFSKTIDSLAAQADKNFSVLISDNFSVKGADHIERALKVLAAAGVPARKVHPPVELDRVGHWNWVHHQSNADWLKPLFAGDGLGADYILTLRRTAQAEPACGYIYCGYQLHQGEKTETFISHWSGRFFTAVEMKDVVLRYAMQFGPPSAAAYTRQVFLQSGGYDPSLPICADSLFFCTLAYDFGGFGLKEALCHFHIHGDRFGAGLSSKRRESFRESMTYFYLLAYRAWTDGVRVPKVGFSRLLAREIRNRWFTG